YRKSGPRRGSAGDARRGKFLGARGRALRRGIGAMGRTIERRLVVLGVVAVVLAVLLAPAMRSYVAQRRQIDALSARVAAQGSEVVDLQRQRQAWDDPAYVKAQARDRLKFVMPGERAYTVIDPAPTARPPARTAQVVAAPAGRAWFGSLWESVRIAGAR
ncbi:MAG: septum formation initiator family protein, partial [Rhodoferax sp.]|nr:septum formation initiator family protein [Actinomycetota bacterium]